VKKTGGIRAGCTQLGRNEMKHATGEVCCAQSARRQPSRNLVQALQAARLRASDLMGQQVNGKGYNAVKNRTPSTSLLACDRGQYHTLKYEVAANCTSAKPLPRTELQLPCRKFKLGSVAPRKPQSMPGSHQRMELHRRSSSRWIVIATHTLRQVCR
jgi:hypothetical protein